MPTNSLEKKPKTKAVQKREIASLASEVVSALDKNHLVTTLADKLNISPEESIDLLRDKNFEKEVHQQLTESIAGGAIAVTAISKLTQMVEAGDMAAIRLVLAFNKTLKPSDTGPKVAIQDNRQVNIWSQLDQKAKGLLGEG